MTKTFTYTQARASLASLCKDVTDDSDYVMITQDERRLSLRQAESRNPA